VSPPSSCIHDHGRWGRGDQLGAAHLLTPERALAALGLVRQGRILDLGQAVDAGAPRMAPGQTPYVLVTSSTSQGSIRRRRALGASNDAGSNLERIELTTHVGTHIDALGHFTIGDRMHGGFSAAATVDDFGLVNLGIEHCPPFVTRGIVLDVSGHDGGDHLEAGRPVTVADLQRALGRAGVRIAAGDVVCLHTGWGRFYAGDAARYIAGEPGLDLEAARWLTAQDVVAIAADNMAIEVMPSPDHPASILPVHQHCLAEAGVYLIENLATAALIEAAVAEFCFVLSPLKLRGATGSPVRPIGMI
jgi:kynurenine formamidase